MIPYSMQDASIVTSHVLIAENRVQRDLGNRVLLLKDKEGYPFLPLFLYEETVMGQSITKGLFRGPLLLKVGYLPSPKTASDIHRRHIGTFFLAHLTPMG